MSLYDQVGAWVAAVMFAGMSGLAAYRMIHQGFLHRATLHLVFIFFGSGAMAFGTALAILGMPMAWLWIGAGMAGCVIPTALTIQPIAKQPLDPPSDSREADLAARLVRVMGERDAALNALDVAEETIERLRDERDLEMMKVAQLQLETYRMQRTTRSVHLQSMELHHG